MHAYTGPPCFHPVQLTRRQAELLSQLRELKVQRWERGAGVPRENSGRRRYIMQQIMHLLL